MAQHPNDVTTDEEIDAALERAKAFEHFPRIIQATYIADPHVNCLMLRLNNGQRMLIPTEMLGELKDATPEQAADVTVAELGYSIWWPQLDDGLYLPDFLEHRWGKEWQGIAA